MIPARLLTDSVSVQTLNGEGAYGPIYGTAVAVACRAESERQLVRDANGEEVVSELRLFVAPADEAKFLPGSLVAFAGRTSTVLSASPKSRPGAAIYAEVVCT